MFEGVKWSAISHGPVRVIGEYIQRHVKYYILSSAAERWLRMCIAQKVHKEVYCMYASPTVASRKRQLRGCFVGPRALSWKTMCDVPGVFTCAEEVYG